MLIQFSGRTIVSAGAQLLPAAVKDVDDGCVIAQRQASFCDPVAQSGSTGVCPAGSPGNADRSQRRRPGLY